MAHLWGQRAGKLRVGPVLLFELALLLRRGRSRIHAVGFTIHYPFTVTFYNNATLTVLQLHSLQCDPLPLGSFDLSLQ